MSHTDADLDCEIRAKYRASPAVLPYYFPVFLSLLHCCPLLGADVTQSLRNGIYCNRKRGTQGAP